METAQETFRYLQKHFREIAKLQSINELLGWDERTMLPPKGAAFRAEQMTLLSGMVHAKRTDPRVGDWLNALTDSSLTDDPHSDTGATIRQLQREYRRQVRLPQQLVERITRASVLGQQAWVAARGSDDYGSFAPHLEEIFGLLREKADALGYEECRYDALLDEFEPQATTADVTRVLGQLAAELANLVREIVDAGRKPPQEVLRRQCPIDAQRGFGQQAAAKIGFEFTRGRLDVTDHPFCAGMGPNDCRITTRYDEEYFPSAFFGILHEAGHGIYEQGLRQDQFGLPPGSFASLGIHESQSRLWENQVGRSRAFWEHFFPAAQQAFPATFADIELGDFCWAINEVRPSLIRVEADEVTYNLHIVIRFELERAILDEDLTIADLPAAWNEKYEQYLGIRPPSDANGVLQDIHWSAALTGYFPTYALGNLYAAQLFAKARGELTDLDDQFRRGEFQPLRQWLRTHIHEPGQCYSAAELVRRATGSELSVDPLLDYLRDKLRPLYGLD